MTAPPEAETPTEERDESEAENIPDTLPPRAEMEMIATAATNPSKTPYSASADPRRRLFSPLEFPFMRPPSKNADRTPVLQMRARPSKIKSLDSRDEKPQMNDSSSMNGDSAMKDANGFRRDGRKRRGAGLVEVGALIGLVAVVAISTVSVAGRKMAEIFGGTANAVALGMNGQLSTSGGLNLAGGVAAGNQPPTISTPAGTVGSVRPGIVAGTTVAIISASDPDGDSVTFSQTGLPAWLSFGTDGRLVVTAGQTPPNVASDQTFPFSVSASDGQTSTAAAYSVTLRNSSPTISTPASQSIGLGVAPPALVAADADSDAISWNASGTLPTGLSLVGDGTWTGTATVAGTWTPTITANDGKGGSSSLTATIVVTPPVITCAGGGVTQTDLGGGHGKCVFAYSGAAQTISIDAGSVPVTAKLWGAGGGGVASGGGGGQGGAGGYATGTLALTTSVSPVTILVGQGGLVGGSAANAYGGGGRANPGAGNGGGRSALRIAGEDVATAGAGGGGAWTVNGGAGGGTNGANGTLGSGCTPVAGLGGGQGAGGAGSPAGAKYQGANTSENNCMAAGGGGGWYGGGAGAGNSSGGGGSGYVGGLSSGTMTAGSGTTPGNSGDADRSGAGAGGASAASGGNGRVVLSW